MVPVRTPSSELLLLSPNWNRENNLGRKYSRRTSRNLSRLNSDIDLTRAWRNLRSSRMLSECQPAARIPSRHENVGRSESLSSLGRFSNNLNGSRDFTFASQPCHLTLARNESENYIACRDFSCSNFLAELKRNHEAYHKRARLFTTTTQPNIRSKVCERCGGVMPFSQSFCNSRRRSMIQ